MLPTPNLYPVSGPSDLIAKAGFRFGAKGTHTSRTMMLTELSAAFAAVSPDATRDDFAAAIIEGNCLGKATTATRRLTNQRLGELYALDPAVSIFRVLRRLWAIDYAGHALLALQCAIARDPLLAATVTPILSLRPGSDLQRDEIGVALRQVVGERLSDATLDKVIRNVSSSWAQSGHLVGRTFKKRALVRPTTGTVAFGLYLAHAAGFRGMQLFSSGWLSVLDTNPASAMDMAVEAKRSGLIDLRISGEVIDLVLDRLDPPGKQS